MCNAYRKTLRYEIFLFSQSLLISNCWHGNDLCGPKDLERCGGNILGSVIFLVVSALYHLWHVLQALHDSRVEDVREGSDIVYGMCV